MRLFFLTIPKPLRQHPILKKIIHSAIFKGLGEKLPDPSFNYEYRKLNKIYTCSDVESKGAFFQKIKLF